MHDNEAAMMSSVNSEVEAKKQLAGTIEGYKAAVDTHVEALHQEHKEALEVLNTAVSALTADVKRIDGKLGNDFDARTMQQTATDLLTAARKLTEIAHQMYVDAASAKTEPSAITANISINGAEAAATSVTPEPTNEVEKPDA